MSRRRPRLVQAALAVVERRGRCLICRRRRGEHLGGYWELPGGKRKVGESWAACLRRELHEELGITVRALTPYGRFAYEYADRRILFKVFRCVLAKGRPRPLASQVLRWVTASQLRRYRFPPANRGLIRRIVDKANG